MRSGSARGAARWSLAAALLLPLGCGDSGTSEPPADDGPYATPPALEPFPLRPTVTDALAALESELAPSPGIGPGVEEGPDFPAIPEAEETPSDPEEVRGLAQMVGGASGQMRELALADAEGLGVAAIPELIALANDAEASDEARIASIEILSALPDPRAEITLLELLRTLESPGLRAHAAWRLSEGDLDAVVPPLVLRLKYEQDGATLRWIATALARYGNFAGVEDLLRRADEAPDEASAAYWRETPDALAAARGFADGPALLAAWEDADPALSEDRPARSAGFEKACWFWIRRLGDYQLRGVDDARFLFQRMDGPAAALLARALHDEDVHVRTHAAQCLERMGPRGRTAHDELVAALADPLIGARAANALGSLRDPLVANDLLPLTAEGVPMGLRLAAVRGLAQHADLYDETVGDRLQTLFTSAPSAELWQAAGEGLLVRGAGPEVVHALAECLVGRSPHGRVEPRTTDDAIRAWLARRAASGEAAARTALEAWDAVAIDTTYYVPTDAEVTAMRNARRDLAVGFAP